MTLNVQIQKSVYRGIVRIHVFLTIRVEPMQNVILKHTELCALAYQITREILMYNVTSMNVFKIPSVQLTCDV